MGNKASDNAAKSVYLPSRTTFHKTQGSMKTEDQRFVKRVQSQTCLCYAERRNEGNNTNPSAMNLKEVFEAGDEHVRFPFSETILSTDIYT